MKKPGKRGDPPAVQIEAESEPFPGARDQIVTDGGLQEAYRLIVETHHPRWGKVVQEAIEASPETWEWLNAASFPEIAEREMAEIAAALMAEGWPFPGRRVFVTGEPPAGWRYADDPDLAAAQDEGRDFLHMVVSTHGARYIKVSSAPFTETRLLAELWEAWEALATEPDPARQLIRAIRIGEARERLAIHLRAAEDARAGRKVRRGGSNAAAVRAAEKEGRRVSILEAMEKALSDQAAKGIARPNVAEAARAVAPRLKADPAAVRRAWYRREGK